MIRIWPKLSIFLALTLLVFPLPAFAKSQEAKQDIRQEEYRLELKPVYHNHSYSISVSIHGAWSVEAGKLVVTPVNSSKQFTVDIYAPKQVIKFNAAYPKLNSKQCFRVHFDGKLDKQPKTTRLSFAGDKGLFCVYTPKVTTPNGDLQTSQPQPSPKLPQCPRCIWDLLKIWVKVD